MELKVIQELQNLFNSISCLCAEGPEFYGKMELVEAIGKDARKGYDICKQAIAAWNERMSDGV